MAQAIITLVVLGGLFGACLYVASKYLSVEVDPRVERISDVLPGANCGGCAFGGCAAYAKAVVAGAADAGRCSPGGESVARMVAEIMGIEFSGVARQVSVLKCAGDCEKCPPRATYDGVATCSGAKLVQSAAKGCTYGCIGLADCAKACPFDAIVMDDKGMPFVIESRCTSCGKCVDACPNGLFEIRPDDAYVHVRCSSHDGGAATRKACTVGCIACGRCVKACKFDAIEVVGDLAVIDYDKCKGCGACVGVCPQGTIWTYRKVRKDRAKTAESKAAAAAS